VPKKILGQIHQYILYPLITAIIVIVIFKIVNPYLFPTRVLKLYVVGDFSDNQDEGNPKADAVKNLLVNSYGCDALAQDSKQEDWKLKVNGMKVCVQLFNDNADKDDATQISQQISRDPDALMVIGHFSSALTQAVLPTYLHASPPISTILVSDTNPDLLKPLENPDDRPHLPVLRLSPSDSVEADEAARFAAEQACLFWVVEDGSNDKYTGYLAKGFVSELLKQQSCKSDENRHPGVIAWSRGMNLPAAPELKSLNIDGIFFVGGWQNAAILIRQVNSALKEKGRPVPKIFIGDMAANAELLHAGGNELLNTFATTRLPATKFMEKTEGGYMALAKTTLDVVEAVIEEANLNYPQGASYYSRTFKLRQLLSLDTPRDARAAVDYWIEAMSNDQGANDPDTKGEILPQVRMVQAFVRKYHPNCGDYHRYYRQAEDARIFEWSVCPSLNGSKCCTKSDDYTYDCSLEGSKGLGGSKHVRKAASEQVPERQEPAEKYIYYEVPTATPSPAESQTQSSQPQEQDFDDPAGLARSEQ
jgi:hypothetical protein